MGADTSGIFVEVDGNKMPVRWKELSDCAYVQLASATMPDDPAMLFAAGAIAAATKMDVRYNKIFDHLVEKDVAKARELQQLAAHR
jgi:hypothetical protein